MLKLNESLESNNETCTSELSDPLHDSSLLSELFYTTKKNSKAEESSIIFSDDDDVGDGERNDETSFAVDEQNTKESSQKRNSTMVDGDDHQNETMIGPPGSDDDESFSRQNNTDNSVSSDLAYKKLLPDSVSVEKLTMLGRAKSAKFVVHDLTLSDQANIGVVYFVEFDFPVSTGHEDNAVATETICNVSKKIESNSVVSFDRISLFPLVFNEEMVNYWWNTYLHLKCFIKKDKNRKHVLFGEADLKLRDVLLSEGFKLESSVEVYGSTTGKAEKRREIIGRIKV